jgi:hypothetical protein
MVAVVSVTALSVGAAAWATSPKRDDRGRTVDIHALRHTFGTYLSLTGVAPKVAQAAMRHFSIHLTMNVCTAPTLLNVAGAINALSDFAQPTAPSGRSRPD